MNRSQLRKYLPGTAEYIILHGAWSHSRGRAPSATLPFELNPRRALRWAKSFGYFSKNGKYLSGSIPANYICGECGVTGVKLWRDYNTFMDAQTLRCMVCACREQKKSREPTEDGRSLYAHDDHVYRTSAEPEQWLVYDPEKGVPTDAIETKVFSMRTDQIGWRVPAVPTEDGKSYWGYTSVPQPGCDWWGSLPTTLPVTQST